MIARLVGTVRMMVVASPSYLERHGTPKHPSQLVDHDCIAWSTLGPLNSWWFRSGRDDQTFPIHTRLATTSAESAIAAALAGLGLVQTTSYQTAAALREGELRIVLSEFECAPTPVSLVNVSNRLLPLKIRAFIDFVAPRLVVRLEDITARIAQLDAETTEQSFE
jgi:DNA-binding transcriptional LysR family regulator